MVIENYFREKNYNLNGFGRHPSSSQRPNRMSIKKWPEKGKRKGNIKVTKKVTRKSPKTVMNVVNCKIHHWKSHQKRWRKRWITENLTGKVTKKGEGKGESPKISPKKSKKNLGSYMDWKRQRPGRPCKLERVHRERMLSLARQSCEWQGSLWVQVSVIVKSS